MEEYKSKVYVLIDDKKCITKCDGGYTPPSDLSGWILIDEGIGDKYNLCQSHYFDKPIYTVDCVPRYKLVDGKAVERTSEEIEADKPELPLPQPTIKDLIKENELLKAQIKAQSDRNDFMEDCIAEMSMHVYS